MRFRLLVKILHDGRAIVDRTIRMMARGLEEVYWAGSRTGIRRALCLLRGHPDGAAESLPGILPSKRVAESYGQSPVRRW